MIELLAPGGSEAKMRTAFEYGADAVYLGGDAFGLRANAENFTLQQIADAAAFAGRRGKKIYVTMNIFARNGDLKEMARYAAALSQTKVHGVIVSDPGAFLTVREAAPELPLHVSTQANTLNWRTCEFWKKMGAVRVNLARELTLSEIAEISAALGERDAVCSAIILPRAPPIAATARSPAAGTIKLRKKTGPESLCRQRKPSAEHFFLILKTCVCCHTCRS